MHTDPPTLLIDEQAKRRDLRRMKAIATGFLLVATLTYLLCRWLQSRGTGDWVGFVTAAAEAGMVGALADWFAVTALFRHPLGLPIPHTAIVRRKKDQLGQSLGAFVGANFLSPEVVSDKVAAARIPQRIGGWLAEESNAARVSAETSTMLRALVEVLRDEDVQQVIDRTIVRRLGEPLWGPPIGRVLAELLAENRQLPLLDMLAERAHQWAQDSEQTIDTLVMAQAPSWSPKLLNILLAERVQRELIQFTAKVRDDPDHELRRAVNRFLAEFAHDLQNDPETIGKAERIKTEIMGRAEITGLAEATWRVAKRLILESVDDPNGTLRMKLTENARELGIRLRDDEQMGARVERWLLAGTTYLAANYATEITGVITDTVQRWDADEAGRKIELQVGRDLQFIRINGTVVGALAGLAIYSFGHFLFG